MRLGTLDWITLAAFCGLFACLFFSVEARAMTHTVTLRIDADPGNLTRVGILTDGVATTSVPLVGPDPDGLWRATAEVQFGSETRAVLFNSDDLVGPASNPVVFENCYWDRDGNGRVGGSDFAHFLREYLLETATPQEYASFKRAFGMYCPPAP